MSTWASASSGTSSALSDAFSSFPPEVVLSLLISKFTFELSDKPIVWNISGIRFPTVGVDGTKPELPLKVSLYKDSA